MRLHRLTDTDAEHLSGGAPFPSDLLALCGAVEHGDGWTAWDWCRWGAPWLILVLVSGPMLLLVIEYLHPWTTR